MSGEAPLKAQLFTGHIGSLIVTLRITPGEDFLAVFVQEPSRTEVYNQEVTARFLQGSETLSGFKSYVELYEFLTKNFATVAFVSNALKFEYKGKPAFVDLVLKVRSNFPDTLTSSEIADIEAQIAAQKQILQKKIKDFQTSDQAQIDNIQKQIDKLQEDAKLLKDKIIASQAEISKLIQETAQKIHAVTEKKKTPAFYNNPGNIYQFYYTVATPSLTTATIVCHSKSPFYYTFVNGTPIGNSQKALYSKAKYSIRATRIYNIDIPPMVGFCTRSGNGKKDNQKNEESAYYSYSGWMNVGGVPNDINVKSGVGDLIECEVDMKTHIMKWWKNSKLFKQATVPKLMEKRTVFLSIMLWEDKDSLDLAVVPV